jgi:hypothetical protein
VLSLLSARRALALVAAALLALPACGTSGTHHAVKVREIPLSSLPSEMLGMQLQREESASLVKAKRPFIEQVGLFSMRKDKLLQATLQISRFSKDAKAKDARFRESVVNQVSVSTPQILRMGSETVYLSTGQRQSLVVWFKDRTMFVLAVREEYPQPRALLRKALEIPA